MHRLNWSGIFLTVLSGSILYVYDGTPIVQVICHLSVTDQRLLSHVRSQPSSALLDQVIDAPSVAASEGALHTVRVRQPHACKASRTRVSLAHFLRFWFSRIPGWFEAI